jgi:O-acetyl-ADP-ribose deacetylase (regulator of RNase III)
MIVEITGDITKVDAQYIANVYKGRVRHDKMGTLSIKGNGEDQRYVINMFSQYYPGSPKYINDTASIREHYFIKCLEKIAQIDNLESIAFPEFIGCLDGGNWVTYKEDIVLFDNLLTRLGKNVTIYIVKWDQKGA